MSDRRPCLLSFIFYLMSVSLFLVPYSLFFALMSCVLRLVSNHYTEFTELCTELHREFTDNCQLIHWAKALLFGLSIVFLNLLFFITPPPVSRDTPLSLRGEWRCSLLLVLCSLFLILCSLLFALCSYVLRLVSDICYLINIKSSLSVCLQKFLLNSH
ncbi:MAG: hypothetical protein BWZ00_00298 [Bacteroidetes bacterium ADurb.BinA174]|nr:MAG: hypothetical protein BWZ00_00298 [Bacteroidetes bacterium ADurb.BinA174]